MKRWIFTFGMGTNLHDAYCVVEASDETTARNVFIGARDFVLGPGEGRKGWSSVYPEQMMEQGEIGFAKRRVDITEPVLGEVL